MIAIRLEVTRCKRPAQRVIDKSPPSWPCWGKRVFHYRYVTDFPSLQSRRTRLSGRADVGQERARGWTETCSPSARFEVSLEWLVEMASVCEEWTARGGLALPRWRAGPCTSSPREHTVPDRRAPPGHTLRSLRQSPRP